MTKPIRTEICCADHDHSLGMDAVPPCKYGVKVAEIELTDAEIAQQEADRIAWEAEQEAREAAATALANLKASAKAKLVAGTPLTAEEADTLVL
jgi:hypothetical protein